MKNVLADFVQSEIFVTRGEGACDESPQSLGRLPGRCEAAAGTGESALGVMLWSVSDELTEAMFASGADGAITELVTGYVESTDHPFMFRTTAWRFPNGVPTSTPIVELIKGCSETSVSGATVTLLAGNEPAVVAYADEKTVYLYEGIHPTTPEGEKEAFPFTSSGLLPADAAAAIAEWWRGAAPAVLEVGHAV